MLLMLSVDVPLLISVVVPWEVHEQPITRMGWHIKPKGSGLNSTSATCDAQVSVAVAVTAPLFAEADAVTVTGPPSWRQVATPLASIVARVVSDEAHCAGKLSSVRGGRSKVALAAKGTVAPGSAKEFVG